MRRKGERPAEVSRAVFAYPAIHGFFPAFHCFNISLARRILALAIHARVFPLISNRAAESPSRRSFARSKCYTRCNNALVPFTRAYLLNFHVELSLLRPNKLRYSLRERQNDGMEREQTDFRARSAKKLTTRRIAVLLNYSRGSISTGARIHAVQGSQGPR